MTSLTAFLPELVLLLGALVLFVITLGESRLRQARAVALATAAVAILAGVGCLGQQASLFNEAYRVDLFSQVLKLVFAVAFGLMLLLSGGLEDIREEVKPEYYLFLAISVSGLMMLVSAVDVITLVVALEVSAFPLYLLVAMRREREGHRVQMESAVKYMMFGIAANGIMFFGLSYLFGLTGTTSLPLMMTRLQPLMTTPVAIAGLALTLAGLFYKLAIFPFQFWTPDVYQGAANQTAAMIASLPKIGGVAVLVRFVSLATPDNHTLALLLAILATASMCYGNLIALMQTDFKRLLGFSGIAHAGYALIGFVALSDEGLLGRALLHRRLPAHGAGLFRGDLPGLERRRQRGHRGFRGLAPALALARGDSRRGRVRAGGHPPLRRLHGQADAAQGRPGQGLARPGDHRGH